MSNRVISFSKEGISSSFSMREKSSNSEQDSSSSREKGGGENGSSEGLDRNNKLLSLDGGRSGTRGILGGRGRGGET